MANGCGCGNNNSIKAYFKLEYKPNKLSQLENDTNFQDSADVADSISEHNTSESAHEYIQGLVTAEENAREQADNVLQTNINSEVTARENADITLEATLKDYANNAVNVHNTSETAHTDIRELITNEATARETEDNNLQSQIDALTAASNVTDIVGTYAELQSYDTSKLQPNDIIKVINDNTHENAASYYRWTGSAWSYIGSEAVAYTKAEADALFVEQTTTVNGKALNQNITLNSSDIGALSDTTTINDLTTTAQQNVLNSGATSANIEQIATNTNDIITINGKISDVASSTNKLIATSELSAAISDFANQDLNNLTTNGNNRLHALKGYLDNGTLLTDAEGLADVTNYAHSTFDSSKFTIEGSPTITNDGIVSNFSSTSGIYAPPLAPDGSSWEIGLEMEITADAITNPNDTMQLYTYPADEGITILTNYSISGYDRFVVQLLIPDMGYDYNLLRINCKSNNGEKVVAGDIQGLKIGYDKTTQTYYFKAYKNGVEYAASGQVSAGIIRQTSRYTAIGFRRGVANSSLNNIDLKSYYVKYDGVTVFSGNKTGVDTFLIGEEEVNIPYTLSKTGSKIVDAVYRDRVKSMYEQYGYAPYYTLGDEDFTLPMGELYGNFQRTLRDSYRNSINYWELWSDRTLEQGGSCTSGVEVNLLKEFADTNYVLTVPYSAKTVSSFTPTQSGDWIAKGVGTL